MNICSNGYTLGCGMVGHVLAGFQMAVVMVQHLAGIV